MVAARAAQIGTVDSIEAVQSNAAAAAIAINPHTSSVPESASAVPVTLFVLHGSFDDVAAKEPSGSAPPTGDVMAYIVNQKEEIAAMSLGNEAIHLSGAVQQLSSMSLGNEAVPLSGAVQQFSSTQDRATIARARHKLPKAPRARVATWGNNCKIANSHHCYDLAEWAMTGHEEVRGAYEFQDTTAMDVPDSESGAFVDNEQWVSMYETKGGSWMENGQQGGEYKGCCQIWWFFAM
jgi:hypothetical protein